MCTWIKIPDSLQCLCTASVTEQGGSYRIETPREEVERGELDIGGFYRVSAFTHTAASSSESLDAAPNTSLDAQQGPPVGRETSVRSRLKRSVSRVTASRKLSEATSLSSTAGSLVRQWRPTCIQFVRTSPSLRLLRLSRSVWLQGSD